MIEPIEAKDAIERLCKLQGVVTEHIGYEYAADCFCGGGGFWGAKDYDGTFKNGYRNDGAALEYIEKAVAEKMARDRDEGSEKS